MSHRSCSQGKLRACPLLHHPLKTSLDYYYSTIPRSFPDLTCNSSSTTSTIKRSTITLSGLTLLLLFIHSLFQSGQPSLLSGSLPFIAHRRTILCPRQPRHTPNASTIFDIRLLLDSSFTYTPYSPYTQSAWSPDACTRQQKAFIPPNQPSYRQAPVPTTAASRILTTLSIPSRVQ